VRYIGNKENILEMIEELLKRNHVSGRSFFDFFAGTASVGRFFKKRGLKIYSSDLLFLSYCFQKACVENNQIPSFSALLPTFPGSMLLFVQNPLTLVLEYLNELPGVSGFIHQNYTPGGTSGLAKPRMYFSDENGMKIDAVRQKIEEWKRLNLLTESEYFILLASLIESVSFFANVSGVYAAFQKKWDPRAVKPFFMRPVEIVPGKEENQVFNADSMEIFREIEADIFYLDPPYNARQYAPNYHLLETIARYDAPPIHGVTGMRDYKNQKSVFCNETTALEALEEVAKKGRFKFLVLSYNSEGIMPSEKIVQVLKPYGTVIFEQFGNTRFKSNNNGAAKTVRQIQEYIFILKRK